MSVQTEDTREVRRANIISTFSNKYKTSEIKFQIHRDICGITSLLKVHTKRTEWIICGVGRAHTGHKDKWAGQHLPMINSLKNYMKKFQKPERYKIGLFNMESLILFTAADTAPQPPVSSVSGHSAISRSLITEASPAVIHSNITSVFKLMTTLQRGS